MIHKCLTKNNKIKLRESLSGKLIRDVNKMLISSGHTNEMLISCGHTPKGMWGTTHERGL